MKKLKTFEKFIKINEHGTFYSIDDEKLKLIVDDCKKNDKSILVVYSMNEYYNDDNDCEKLTQEEIVEKSKNFDVVTILPEKSEIIMSIKNKSFVKCLDEGYYSTNPIYNLPNYKNVVLVQRFNI